MYLLISSTAKSYNFPKLSEAWVIFQGSKPDREETCHDKTMSKNRTIEQFHLMELHSMQKWNLDITKLYCNLNNILRINNEQYRGNYFSPVIVKYEEKNLVIVNIACQSLSLSLYQGFTVSTVTKACVQSSSQKGVQPSFGCQFLKEIQGKFTLSLIILGENKPSGKPVFQCLAKSLHV